MRAEGVGDVESAVAPSLMPRSLPPAGDEAKGLRYDPGAAMTNRLLRSTLVLLALVGAATGCTRYYWAKAGATPEQFAGDSQECVRQAATALPAGAAIEAVEQFYRACLQSRGYVRDTQTNPPPPGFFRGLEDGEEFSAAVAAMAPGAPAIPAPPSLAGRWYGRGGAILDIRTAGGRRLEWEWEMVGPRTTTRASGTGTVNGNQVSLTGYATGTGSGALLAFRFTLTHAGPVLRGVSHGPSNVPANVEFRRERP